MANATKALALLGFLAMSGWAAQAQAEDLKIACYVDTPAFDQYTEDACASYWFNGPATTSAVFEVFGQDAGVSYTYQWSVTGCSASNKFCIAQVRANRDKTVSVVVTNNSTGISRTFTAVAEYWRD
ncbi:MULTISPECIES: hypothetical protein [unclassified Lysobacter]|uniref:hypothetical protein n=1 Tax=unclassified Lysobacter TaxID=2635362 RepID=UPI0006F3C42B|nr:MULTISPECIES: hypothetical protein [unclassified Lysobacter]KRC31225.1 hypothetical protein ASE10_18375 [Lysobacter sp. Root76]KRD65717.1 hypothetical protein ASE45_17080 [Lysobacter sp. Root96]